MSYGQPKPAGATLGGCAAKPCVESAPQRTLDSLIKDAVSFVGQIDETRCQAAAVRERLCGSWPEEPEGKDDRSIDGQLDALEQFQRDAWNALYALRGHLAAIQQSLG